MKGYYKNPEATAEVIVENGFLHSGDLGVKDEDGNMTLKITDEKAFWSLGKYLVIEVG